jgi:hypothetical protein
MGTEIEIVGKKIEVIRPMTRAEARAIGWADFVRGNAPPVLVLEGGTLLFPSRDSEGNGPGVLWGTYQGDLFTVTTKLAEM